MFIAFILLLAGMLAGSSITLVAVVLRQRAKRRPDHYKLLALGLLADNENSGISVKAMSGQLGLNADRTYALMNLLTQGDHSLVVTEPSPQTGTKHYYLRTREPNTWYKSGF